MAGTTTSNFRLIINNGSTVGSTFDTTSQSITATMTGTHISANVQTIPTTAGGTAITITSGVATYGMAYFQNQDLVNYVSFGVKVSGTYYPIGRLLAGEEGLFRLDPTTTLYALANTASINLYTVISEA